jgi:hypothetical protein
LSDSKRGLKYLRTGAAMALAILLIERHLRWQS